MLGVRSAMNGFDILLLAVLVVCGVLGALSGIVRAAVGLCVWVLAGLVAWLFSEPVAAALKGTIAEPTLRLLMAFVIVFALVLVGGTLTGRMIHRLVEAAPVLKLSNRVLGAFAGVTGGVALVLVVFVLAGLTSVPQQRWWRHSALAPYFQSMAVFVGEYLPSDLARHIRYG